MTHQEWNDAALLLLRVVVGGTMVAHGYNHAFGAGGLSGTAGWFASMGLRPPMVHATLSAAGEIGAGLLLILGLMTPLGCAFVVGSMAVAWWVAHRRNGYFIFRDGYEYVLALSATALGVSALGAGRFSVDAAAGWGDDLRGGAGVLIAAGLGLGGALLLVVTCWRTRTGSYVEQPLSTTPPSDGLRDQHIKESS